MSNAVLSNKQKIYTQNLRNKQKVYTRSINNSNFYISKINDVLPFRIRFTNIGIPGYGPGNVPPIGIAIIGLNNYIL